METSEKVSIGKPNTNRVKRILSHYENITESLNSVKWGIDDLYKDFEPVPLAYLFEILKSEKPADLLKLRFAEMRGI